MGFATLTSHPSPKNILVVIGEHSGLIDQVLKFPYKIEMLVRCEVIIPPGCDNVKFIPHIVNAADKKKSHTPIHIAFGIDFVDKQEDIFDVILTDFLDPSPGTGTGSEEDVQQKILTTDFFQALAKALKPNGIFAPVWARYGTLRRSSW